MRRSAWIALMVLAFGACGDSSPRAAVTARTSSATTPDVAETLAPPTPAGPSGVEFHSAARLARLADELANGSTTGRTIGGQGTYSFVQARRVVSGEPEVHDHWIDIAIVQAGRAILLTGGHVDGGHLASSGEHRGGTIVGGTTRQIATGDVFVVSAGVPHQYQLARGDSVRYLTLKVLQASGGGCTACYNGMTHLCPCTTKVQ